MATPTSNSLIIVGPSVLNSGHLAQLFRRGTKAVILSGDERVAKLWEELVVNTQRTSESSHTEVLPWDSNFTETARNHKSEGPAPAGRGDVWCYISGTLGYTARKISITKNWNTKKIEAYPEGFYNNGRYYQISENLYQTAWDLMEEIMLSMSPKGDIPDDYEVVLERVKYDDNIEDTVKKMDLITDSCGRWSKIGHEVDHYKASMVGPFNLRYVRDITALLCLIPITRSLIQALNNFFYISIKKRQVPGGAKLIGIAHTDGRYVTCLFSSRDQIRTEFYDDHTWNELPVLTHTLTIMPGRELPNHYRIRPTTHRVLVADSKRFSHSRAMNITFVLGARKRRQRL